MKQLDQVLADARGEAAVARRLGHEAQAQTMERFCDDVADAARDYLTWLSEAEAQLRSGRAAAWLRARFPGWQREGHARLDGRRRQYRALIVPRRADVTGAYRAGRQAGAA